MKHLKKWQMATLIVFALLDFTVLGIGIALIALPSQTTAAVATVTLPSPTPIPTHAPLPTITPRPALTPDKAFLSAHVNCSSSKAWKEMVEAFNSFETYYRNGTLCSKWIVNAEPAIVSASKCLYDLPEPTDRDLVVAWKDSTSAAIFVGVSIKSFKNYCNTGSLNSLKSASEALQTFNALLKDATVYMQRYIDAPP